MSQILRVASLLFVAMLGTGIVCCAFHALWRKVQRLPIWKMPKITLSVLAGVAVIATVTAQKGEPLDPPVVGPANLVYRSTFDSAGAITAPLVGERGTCANATFVEGKVGKALSVPAGASVASIPFPNGLPTERGAIEFWAKLDADKTFFSVGGDPMFLYFSKASTSEHFGWLEFNSNNGTGLGGLGVNMGGIGFYTGSYISPGTYASILSNKVSDWHHYAFVWNVDGILTLTDMPRFALLLDGNVVTQSHGDSNWSRNTFVSNMATSLQLDLSCPEKGFGKSPYYIDELRVWDLDVTTFPLNLDDAGARYVDANAQVGGTGTSWETAARTIDEVSRHMNGGVIYVKPGVYGAFAYHEPSTDGEPLRVVAMGNPEETVIDGAGNAGIVSLEAALPHALAPAPEKPMLRLEGFTVRNMNVRACDQAFDRCIVSNYTQGVAFSGWFRNCLIVANESTSSASLFDGCIFDNCTVTGNRTTSNSAINSVAHNSIFWGNVNVPFYGLNSTNCCVEGGAWSGANNIDADPLFVSSDTGDYGLAEGSPCIDAGDNASAGLRDLAGVVRVQNGRVDIGAYEFVPKARLVYHTTLDSADAVAHPVIGAAGICTNVTFVDGKVGLALYVPVHSNVATLPLPDGLPQARGCIEFWAKLQEGQTTYRDTGDPVFMRIFHDMDNWGVFSFEFNANNGGGRGGLCARLGRLGIAPEEWSYSKLFSQTITKGEVSDWHHYAYVWNVDGIDTLNGKPRAAILLDGEVKGVTSGDSGWDKDEFLATMALPLNICFSIESSGWGKSPFAIDELKIWDSDKTTFRGIVAHQDVSYVYDGTAHTLQPAVGAEGDEIFRYALSEEGPFGEAMPTITDAGTLHIWYEVTAEGATTRASATVTVAKRPLTFTSADGVKQYNGHPLFATNVVVSGTVPAGEGFAFAVTGSQTAVGESDNIFTWTANAGTNPDNYDITVVFGTLKVTIGAVDEGIAYEIVHGGTDAVRITRLPYPDGGDVTLPNTLGGLPVTEIAAGALSGTSVTGVRVPAGVVVSGALFENLPNVTNVTLDAGCTVTGALSCRGSAALQEVIVPASVTELAPYAFLGCWALERVVFAGEPPFGNNTDATTELALLTASVRPASLLQMADMICYPAACAAKWEKSLRNLGYGGKYGAYAGEWTGVDSLIADSGNLNKDPGGPASPTEQPAAHYAAQTGVASGTAIPGTAGWDAFGVPDGMTWDRETGTLGGTPKRSGTYDVILVSGSGADTKMMRTTVDVAGYAVTTGYVGTAFKASGAPWNALASYKTAPKGLAWKNKVLSGVPTKAGTTTYKTKDGEPVKVTILALPVGVKGTFNGVLQDGAGKQYPLKVSATAAGKLTATVTKGTKSYSLSAVKWSKVTLEPVDGATHRMFAATLTASGLSLSVKVDADAVWNADALTAAGTQGAIKNLTGTAQRNAYASVTAAQETAAALAGSFTLAASSDGAGGWTLAFPEEGVRGAMTLTLKATGAATLTGTLPNKVKISTSSTLHVDTEGTATVRFYVSGTWITWHPL